MRKRELEIAVISDVHLGTYGCYADELLTYLSSIQPKILILNGDIIDIWDFKASYFPASHLKVIKKIISMASKGTEVFYIKGNHDALAGKSAGTTLGNIKFCDKLVLSLDGKRTWFFHGDVLDAPSISVRWLSRLGSFGYTLMSSVNNLSNWILKQRKREKYSLSGKIEQNKTQSVNYISDFERTVADLALYSDYDCIVCGHIHQPKKEQIENAKGSVLYLNSGDWVEHMTALEYSFKRWKLYRYKNDKLSPFFMDEDLKKMDINELMASMGIKHT